MGRKESNQTKQAAYINESDLDLASVLDSYTACVCAKIEPWSGHVLAFFHSLPLIHLGPQCQFLSGL